MLFSSITFLYAFLPVTLLCYFIAPKRFRNTVLLLASLVFYAFGEPRYVVLLLISSINDFFWSILIEKYRNQPRLAKGLLAVSLAVDLGLLGFFKYADFLIGSVNALFGTKFPLFRIPLPIGISFYTFQTMSYTIDVYRGRARVQKNLAAFGTFVCLFPQLIAGPIVRYTDVADELVRRQSKLTDIALGLRRFVLGLGKKVLLANGMGELCAAFRESASPSILFFWVYAAAFLFQIYFDFSGYSDMAIGLGRVFGFHFPENFDYPYISRSITEFWRRWHMSMGGWFRDYVYIPLGGNRVSVGKWLRNLAVVWLLTGLWHGADWNFVLWGAGFGLILVLEKTLYGSVLQNLPRFFQHLYVLLVVLFGFVLFNGDGLSGALSDLAGMMGLTGIPVCSGETIYFLRNYAVLFALCTFAALPAGKHFYQKIENAKVMIVLEPLALSGVLTAVTASLVDGSFNPFLYFRF